MMEEWRAPQRKGRIPKAQVVHTLGTDPWDRRPALTRATTISSSVKRDAIGIHLMGPS